MNEETKRIKKNKGKVIFLLFSVFFCLLLAFFSLYGILLPDKEMSENENRVLASMPELTVQGVIDGSFMKDFETYLSDQFPFRDEAIYVKSFFERLWGKSRENGVYIGKDGFLFDEQTPYDENKMTELGGQISTFAKKNNLNTAFALVPNSSYIYGEKLPDNLILQNQKNDIGAFYDSLGEEIICIDAVSTLLRQKSQHQVFYKTDHHWTTRGAFSVFLEIAKKLDLDVKEADYEFHTVSTDFEGTLKAKSTFQKGADEVEICFPKGSEGNYYIELAGQTEKTATFFFVKELQEKNKYEVFLGGNYSRLVVTTTLEKGRKLLVIKDSFANCLLPMLTPYFQKIVVVDPRYMTESISKVMQEYEFTDVLFLYNANTFFADTSLSSVL